MNVRTPLAGVLSLGVGATLATARPDPLGAALSAMVTRGFPAAVAAVRDGGRRRGGGPGSR